LLHNVNATFLTVSDDYQHNFHHPTEFSSQSIKCLTYLDIHEFLIYRNSKCLKTSDKKAFIYF